MQWRNIGGLAEIKTIYRARVKHLLALPVLECIDLICELAGVNQAAQDVVGEVTES